MKIWLFPLQETRLLKTGSSKPGSRENTSACDVHSHTASSNCQVKTFITCSQSYSSASSALHTAHRQNPQRLKTLLSPPSRTELGFPLETAGLYSNRAATAKWKWHKRGLHQLCQVTGWGVKILLDTVHASRHPPPAYHPAEDWGVRGTLQGIFRDDHWTSTQNVTYATECISSNVLSYYRSSPFPGIQNFPYAVLVFA